MRLFVGAPVPGADELRLASQGLKGRHPDLRLVPDGSWHVTLRFLGEADPVRVDEALTDALRGRPPIDCRIRGLGAFPSPGAARVVWAGVTAPGIERLAARVQGATALFGKPPEARPFVPHVTLGRFRVAGDVRQDVAHAALDVRGTLAEVVLFRSHLEPGGPQYEALRRYPLRETPA